ncbi:unnamed protein product [Vitrella brassicaformis CCMP3155]|uniref:Uncharacterized protein n=2 Tax=Vitrella brassicaformis TaxID=1169539 RepID=A0A0G4EUL2_VITBC|nr:unnamed protein product [Vitrella brassicaformis CCMP3155]|eukprot:CEM01781.1 unnamed protein product [Vitrella brassicaformis CCMP3155]
MSRGDHFEQLDALFASIVDHRQRLTDKIKDTFSVDHADEGQEAGGQGPWGHTQVSPAHSSGLALSSGEADIEKYDTAGEMLLERWLQECIRWHLIDLSIQKDIGRNEQAIKELCVSKRRDVQKALDRRLLQFWQARAQQLEHAFIHSIRNPLEVTFAVPGATANGEDEMSPALADNTPKFGQTQGILQRAIARSDAHTQTQTQTERQERAPSADKSTMTAAVVEPTPLALAESKTPTFGRSQEATVQIGPSAHERRDAHTQTDRSHSRDGHSQTEGGDAADETPLQFPGDWERLLHRMQRLYQEAQDQHGSCPSLEADCRALERQANQMEQDIQHLTSKRRGRAHELEKRRQEADRYVKALTHTMKSELGQLQAQAQELQSLAPTPAAAARRPPGRRSTLSVSPADVHIPDGPDVDLMHRKTKHSVSLSASAKYILAQAVAAELNSSGYGIDRQETGTDMDEEEADDDVNPLVTFQERRQRRRNKSRGDSPVGKSFSSEPFTELSLHTDSGVPDLT